MNKIEEKVKDKVKHFINPPAIHISARVSVFEACKRMQKHKVGSILVSEGKHFIGIFTEADLLTKVVVTKELLYIDSESTMVMAFLKMQKKNVRHLIVKDDNNVTGVLSIKDIAKYYVKKFSAT